MPSPDEPQRRAARRTRPLYGLAYDGLFRLQQELGEAELNRRLRALDQQVAAMAEQLEAPVEQDSVLRGLLGLEANFTQPPPPVVALRDGATTVTLDAQGDLTGLGPLLPRIKRAVRAALSNPRGVVPSHVVRRLRPQLAALMGDPRVGIAFALLRPVDTAVLEAHLAFAWQPYPGASYYQVTLFVDGKDVLTSEPLPEPAWQPARPLAPGAYTWQVAAYTEGGAVCSPVPPAPEAAFEVLAPDEAARIRLAQETRADSALTLGVLYARAGLLDEAEAAFGDLLVANPAAPVAQQLLQGVQQVRPHLPR